MMTILIRRATANDLPDLVDFSVKLSRQHQAYNPLRFVELPNIEEQHFELFSQEINDAECAVLVAETQSQIVGYAFIRMEAGNVVDVSETSAWLHDIYVDDAVRGLKAGKLLLDAARKAARELGSPVLKLQVATQNEFARKLFESHGFQPTMTEMISDLSVF